MGFRSTFTIEYFGIQWPDWFVEKYSGNLWFSSNNKGVFAPKCQFKANTGIMGDLPKDVQAAIDWDDFGLRQIIMVYLHECGGISRCEIHSQEIIWTEPTHSGWWVTNGITHAGCYGCTDAKEV